ncbi:hypothetical protein EYF80_052603 [Liparis tanakae]|uniref:Uncharacterized protein n=1 Tax=Liparis tanakae TaxID=230148 RepID=A0A4Z2F7V6_9TELE|nr:hypothetical protein EYF80_052603 [Liparis tanakae]
MKVNLMEERKEGWKEAVGVTVEHTQNVKRFFNTASKRQGGGGGVEEGSDHIRAVRADLSITQNFYSKFS